MSSWMNEIKNIFLLFLEIGTDGCIFFFEQDSGSCDKSSDKENKKEKKDKKKENKQVNHLYFIIMTVISHVK